MGGANTEIADSAADPETGQVQGTTEVVIEAAHFDPISIARTARRHKLASEASKRFERGVDPEAGVRRRAAHRRPAGAARRRHRRGRGHRGHRARPRRAPSRCPPTTRTGSRASPTAARPSYAASRRSAATSTGRTSWSSPSRRGGPTSPSPTTSPKRSSGWRGTRTCPPRCPSRRPGRGLTERQRLHRRVGRALAGAGYVEALNYPFIGEHVLDQLGLAGRRPEPPARHARQPALRRGARPAHDAAARAARRAAPQRRPRQPRPGALRDRPGLPAAGEEPGVALRLPVDRRPTDEEIAALDAVLPRAAAARRGRPRGRPRAGRLVGQGPPGRLGRRGRGGAHASPARPAPN